MSRRWTFTSESVTEGHPDKIADQVSDAVLDAIIRQDPTGRVACETLLTTGLVVVAGEITTNCYVDFPKIVRETIKDVGFQGQGCAISKASASMMTTVVKGKTKAEAERLFDEFHHMVKGELDPETEENQLGRLKIFAGVREFPARVKCASLSWHTLRAALEGVAEPVSTE